MAPDNRSRRVMGFAVFRGQPQAVVVRGSLERPVREAGRRPRDLVTDQGRQFIAKGFKR